MSSQTGSAAYQSRLAQNRAAIRIHASGRRAEYVASAPPPEPDTRSLTGRLLGDPPIERSALGQRQSQQARTGVWSPV